MGKTAVSNETETKQRRGAAHRHEEIKMLAIDERKEKAADIIVEGLVRLLTEREGRPGPPDPRVIQDAHRPPLRLIMKEGPA